MANVQAAVTALLFILFSCLTYTLFHVILEIHIQSVTANRVYV